MQSASSILMNLAGKQQVRRLFAKQAVLRSRELGSRGITRVEGVTIRVYSTAKTVADCFKYRNKVGIDVAVEALKDFTRKHRGGSNELARHARICRVARVMQPYLDAIG